MQFKYFLKAFDYVGILNAFSTFYSNTYSEHKIKVIFIELIILHCVP